MPGLLNLDSFHAQFLRNWEAHRDVASDDVLEVPTDVTEVLNLRGMPSALGLQIWVVPQQLTGDPGTLDLALVRTNTGSLAAAAPYVTVRQVTGAEPLETYRFTKLLPAEYRLLVQNVPVGTTWRLHVTNTSGLSIEVDPTVVAQTVDGIAGASGNYAGAEPGWAPASGLGVAVDESNGRLWLYYGGSWH